MNWKLAFIVYMSVDLGLCLGFYLKRRQQINILKAKMAHPAFKLEWTNKDTENSKYPYDQDADDKFLKIISDYHNE